MFNRQIYTVLGAARSGLAVARLLSEEGESVFVSDAKRGDESLQSVEVLEALDIPYEFGGHSERVLEADVIILSPGIPPNIPILLEAEKRGIRVTNEIEIASRYCRGRIIGITGTNGKTTTTELIGHICRTAGRKTLVAGNVGIPFSEVTRQATADSLVVLELSSFQLEKIESFHPDVALLLNVTPDHLDRYESIEEYGAAKLRITMNQTEGDRLIYNGDNQWLRRIGQMDFRPKMLSYSLLHDVEAGAFLRDGNLMIQTDESEEAVAVIPAQEIGIRGPHNLANSMGAALAALSVGIPVGKIREGLASFRPLPHRLEEVAQINGVRYINDSKGTNTDALRYALESFDSPIILIAGGRAKKNRYDALLSLVEERVKAAVLIGEAAEEMEREFTGLTTIVMAGTSMESALQKASELAEPGDVVLLSPACASFDMFRNFEERGEVFRKIVESRAEGQESGVGTREAGI